MLDASAVLALLFDEPGADEVENAIGRAVIATVNWSEVCQWLIERGGDSGVARDHLIDAGLAFEGVTVADAETAAAFRRTTRSAGLSLGDRCCLAVAVRLGRPALTADRAWAAVEAGVAVRLIR